MRTGILSLVLLALAGAGPSAAREVAVPLRLEHDFVRERIVEALFAGPGQTSQALRDATGCSKVVLSQPEISARGDRVLLVTRYAATLAAGTGGWCFGVTDRTGILEAELVPSLHASLPIVEFRVAESQLYEPDGAKRVTGALWDWVKPQVHPHLQRFRLDLRQPLAEVAALLPWLFSDRDAERAQRLVDSLTLSEVRAEPEELVVRMRIDVPEAAAPPPPAPPEAPWSPEELARWEAAWQSWDAFLTFVVKLGRRDGDDSLQGDLRAILLDARHDLVAILTEEQPRERDPVRDLFLDTWERLAPVLRRLSTRLPGETALRYLTFIAAADAAAALEQLGPEYGVELSTDGLRRMARMIEPAPAVDPTAYSEAIDPELREWFGFGPAPRPEELEEPEAETEPAPETGGAPPPPPVPAPPPSPPHSQLPAWRPLLARGGAAPDLDRWVPTLGELPVYLPQVRDLLAATALRTQRKKVLPGEHAALYRDLMLATAWQESCWRQFTRRGGVLHPLTSSAGALGIMQVNPHVWRGFYDVGSLRSSSRYNAVAGSEILHHYLIDYAVARREDEVRGRSEDLARAAYAAYNAGPRQLDRYRRDFRGRQGHPIDAAFFEKYQRIRKGEEMAVASCFPGYDGSV